MTALQKESPESRENSSRPRFCGTHHADPTIEQLAVEARARVLAEIDRLDLHEHVHELDVNGFTVVPPERAAPPGFADALRDAVLVVAERETGNGLAIKPDQINTESDSFGQTKYVVGMIEQDRIFEEALMNETALALTTYLLGESCVVRSVLGMIKGPGTEYMGLHTDQNHECTPAPFPAIAQTANVTWALSDYSEANGSTCYVPGSHKLCRHPNSHEATDLSLFKPIEVPAGSILIWHGNTWHGSVPRKNPGFRVSLLFDIARWYVRSPLPPIAETLSPEVLARNSLRFSVLTGAIPISSISGQGRVAIVSHFG